MRDEDKSKAQLIEELQALRKLSEARLKERHPTQQIEESLRIKDQAIASSVNAIALSNLAGELTYINDSFLRMWGYSDQTEVLGRHAVTFWQSAAEAGQVVITLQKEGSWHGEMTGRRRDGSLFEAQLSAHIILGSNGAPAGMMASFVDVTEHKRALMALRESERQYRTLFTEMPSGLALHEIICDDHGQPVDYRFLEINPAFEQLTGLRRQDILGKTVLAVMPKTESYWIRIYGQVALSGQSVHFENYSGELGKYYEVSAFCPKPGQFVTAFADISERKQAEAQLQEFAQRLSLATSAAKLGIWDWDVAANRLIWDDMNFELYRVRPEEFEGRYETWARCVHPEDLPAASAIAQATLAGEKEFHTRFRIVWPDGQIRFMEAHAVVQRAEDGAPRRMIGVNWDITESIQLTQENEQLQRQFFQAQKMESIGRLAGGVAHDFNNLLVPILGYADLGMTAAPEGSELYDNFVQIKKAGSRAADLTRQILAFSRQQVLEMKILDLNEVVTDVRKMLQRLLGEDISLQTELTAPLHRIKADQGQLEQVLLNLAVNARDAMPTGGRLLIETANVYLDEAYVAKHRDVQPGPYVQLSVSDTGDGMDLQTQERIFEPFFTTKIRGQGTGLGLATVFGIVRQHRGSIWVYSQAGHGTTFKIYLPASKNSVQTVEAARPYKDLVVHGAETVLVVEDDAAVRELVCHTLRSYGYHVLDADGPDEGMALAAAFDGAIHLLITDVIMPEIDGPTLYKQLARDRSDLNVLYMSGYTDRVMNQQGILDEGVTFLQKPFAIRDLLHRVRLALA